MTGFSISMDLAPKQARTDNGTDRSTVEQRLRFFMQDVTGRALVMMESATQGQQGIAMDLVQEAFISLHKSYKIQFHPLLCNQNDYHTFLIFCLFQ